MNRSHGARQGMCVSAAALPCAKRNNQAILSYSELKNSLSATDQPLA
jgi:hypothetical protein